MLETIGKYRIIDRIGTGAMGVVYKGFDSKMGRYVAIKTMSAHLVENEDSKARFRREAIAPAKLFHANIVSIYDLDEHEGVPFIVMEFLDGLDFKYLRTAGIRFSIPQVLNILIQVASGLDYAHRNGVIHRDVKPANLILLKNGLIKILDFGIARVLEGTTTQQTQTGVALGTPAYMSPEQARGLRVDARTDQHALGVIAYQLVAGANPFHADSYTGVLYRLLNHQPPPLASLVPECPTALSDLVDRALAKEVGGRFDSLKSLGDEAARILVGFDRETARLEHAYRDLELQTTAAQLEPYKVQQIRKYIKDFQFEAAARLLENLDEGEVGATLLASLRTELASFSRKQRCAELLTAARAHLDTGEIELALNAYNEVVALEPDNVEALTGVQKSRRLLRERLFETQVKPLLERAAEHTGQGEHLEALELYRRVLAVDPEYVEARVLIEDVEGRLARANRARLAEAEWRQALRAGDLAAAVRHLRDWAAHAESADPVRAARAQWWERVGDILAEWARAAGDAAGVGRLRDDLSVWLADADVLTMLAAPADADRRATLTGQLTELSHVLCENGRHDAARVLLGALRDVLPDQPRLATALASVEARWQAWLAERQQQLGQVRELAEGVSVVRALLDEGQPAGAEERLRELMARFPGQSVLAALAREIADGRERLELDNQLARVEHWLAAGQPERADALLGELEAARPGHPAVAAARARHEGLVQEQRRAAERADQLELIRRLVDRGRLEEAAEAVRRALAVQPDRPELLGWRDDIRDRLAERDRAAVVTAELAELERLLAGQRYRDAGVRILALAERNPHDERVQQAQTEYHRHRQHYLNQVLRRGVDLSASGAFDEARDILARAADECPDAPEPAAAMRRLDAARAIAEAMAEARAGLAEQRYDLALATLEGLLARHPEESGVSALYDQIRTERTMFVTETVRRGRELAGERSYDAALELLRAARETVPNAWEVGEALDEIERDREGFLRQRQLAAEEARLAAAETARAEQEAGRLRLDGRLLDALRVLEQTRRRFPREAARLDGPLREIQELLDLQLHLPVTEGGVHPTTRRPMAAWLLAAAALVAVAALAVWWLAPRPGPPPPSPVPVLLVIDLAPWGEVTELVDQERGQAVELPEDRLTPLRLHLPAGRYRLEYRFGGESDASGQEEIDLTEREYLLVQRTAPDWSERVEETLDSLLADPPP